MHFICLQAAWGQAHNASGKVSKTRVSNRFIIPSKQNEKTNDILFFGRPGIAHAC
jgi:hypothetical protein